MIPLVFCLYSSILGGFFNSYPANIKADERADDTWLVVASGNFDDDRFPYETAHVEVIAS